MNKENNTLNINQVNAQIDALVAKANAEIQDPSTYKYYMYLRKSTDDDTNQITSLKDQKKYCLKKAQELNIDRKNIEIIQEKKSAKVSGNRPEFDVMITNIEAGIKQGILCWSPDRLSRNMKEGGHIIELVDKELLKSLVFCSYLFEATSGGKLTLAILFATAKNYSDSLADATKRGSSSKAEDIQWLGYHVPGYKPSHTTKQLEADEPMWRLLREGIEMALSGVTQKEVAKFLNDKKFTITIFEKNQKYSTEPRMRTKAYAWNETSLSRYFKHPVMIGIYKYDRVLINMLEIEDLDFKPLMTFEEYQAMASYKVKTSNALEAMSGETRKNNRIGYLLLKGKVFCGVCKSKYPMIFARNKVKSTGAYTANFACKNPDCYRKNKKDHKAKGLVIPSAVRAGVVIDSIVSELKSLSGTDNGFGEYKEYWKTQSSLKLNSLTSRRSELNKIIRDLQKKYDNLKELEIRMVSEDGYEYFNKHHKDDLDQRYNSLIKSKAEKSKITQEIAELNDSMPTLEEFFELANFTLMRLDNFENFNELDTLLNEVVSNLVVNADSTAVIKLKKPFAFMQKELEISNGGV